MWDLPRPGLKPLSPALAGGFLTTAPPGKSLLSHFCLALSFPSHCFYSHSDTSHLSPGFLLSLVPLPSSLPIILCSCTPGLEKIFPESFFSTLNLLLLPRCVWFLETLPGFPHSPQPCYSLLLNLMFTWIQGAASVTCPAAPSHPTAFALQPHCSAPGSFLACRESQTWQPGSLFTYFYHFLYLVSISKL